MKEQGVKRCFLPQDIAVLAAMFLAGGLCLLGGEWLNMLGFTFLFCGICMLPFYHHGYRLEGEKGVFRLRELSVARSDKEQILSFLKGETETLAIVPNPMNVGALVDVYYQTNSGRQLARYFYYPEFASGTQYPLHPVSDGQIAALEAINPEKNK